MNCCCKEDVEEESIDEIHPCFISTVLVSSRLFNSMHEFMQTIYKSHPFITKTFDFLFYKCKQADSCMKNHRIEPVEENHVTIGWIYIDEITYHYSLETLFICLQQQPENIDRIITFIRRIVYNNRNSMMFPWIRIRINNVVGEPEYICRILSSFDRFNSLIHSDQKSEKSSVRFLSVEYYHQNNPTTENIILAVDPAYLYEMNELFAPEFIMHLLEHQEIPFHFDMAYTLRIMDNNINIIELKSNQYLLLKKDGYDICNFQRQLFLENK